MSFWAAYLNSYTTNFWDKMCAKICENIAIAGGFFENPHGFLGG